MGLMARKDKEGSSAEILEQYTTSGNLRSANDKLLKTPRYNLKTAGGRSFAVAAPKIWNTFSPEIRHAESLASFISKLKIHLFFYCE